MFGAKDAAEFTALGPWDVSPERQPDGSPSADKAREAIEAALREGSRFFEWTHRRLDGVDFPATVLLTRIEMDGQAFLQATVRDVTVQKQAETALKESEARLRGITDSAQDAILMMDPRGAIEYWNPAAESILGYRREEALGKDLHKLLVPERYQEAHCAAFREFLRTGRGNAIGKTVEVAARRKDGREIAVDLSLSAICLNGEWHAVGMVRDITERKRAEAQLREERRKKEAVLTDLFENAPVAYRELDREGVVRRVNAAACALLGYPAGEILGRPVWDFVAEADRAVSRAAFRRKAGRRATPGARPALLRPARRR